MAKSMTKKHTQKCTESGVNYFKSKLSLLIEKLLEKSESSNVIQVVDGIALYKASEKLKQWIDININDSYFGEEIRLHISKRKRELSKYKHNSDEKIDADTAERVLVNITQVNPSELINEAKV
jgi:hypothetical protein